MTHSERMMSLALRRLHELEEADGHVHGRLGRCCRQSVPLGELLHPWLLCLQNKGVTVTVSGSFPLRPLPGPAQAGCQGDNASRCRNGQHYEHPRGSDSCTPLSLPSQHGGWGHGSLRGRRPGGSFLMEGLQTLSPGPLSAFDSGPGRVAGLPPRPAPYRCPDQGQAEARWGWQPPGRACPLLW